MGISRSNIIFFSIILLTGALTVSTDLMKKKIYNNHLVIGAVLCLAGIIYASVWERENILFHIVNGLIALVIGLCLYRFDLWRGGDAKLFTLYAFLMPPLQREHTLLSGSVNLFACSFITGAIILTPIFIKDIILNYNVMVNHLLPAKKRKDLFNSIRITIFFSWIIFPVYYFARVMHLPLISLVVTYLIFYLAYHYLRKIIWPFYIVFLSSGVIFGLLMRLWLAPESLSWGALAYSVVKIGLFSTFSAGLYTALNLLKEYHDRVPFAPLLFIGCVLSYTSFLARLIQLVTR
jgi:Flp pilus assembly protein protease CpaA